jgi:hypothetical protein
MHESNVGSEPTKRDLERNEAYEKGRIAYCSDLDILEGDEYAKAAYPDDPQLQVDFQDGWMEEAMEGDQNE